MNLLRRIAPGICLDKHTKWALLLMGIAFVLRFCSIWVNLPDVPNPDEFMIVWPPLRMAYGTWYATGGYPPFYMYIMLVEYGALYAFGSLTGHFAGTMDFATQMIADPTPLYLMGRITSVLLGTVTVLVLYAIGRRLYGGRVGLLAATFLAFDTAHVYASQVLKNDVLMVFLLTLSFWFACGILQRGRTSHYVLAGLFAGLAMAAKYNAAVAVLPIVVAHAVRRWTEQKRLWAFFAWPIWLAGLCTAAGFFAGFPHFLLDPVLAWEGLRSNSADFFWAWLGWEGVPLGWIYYPVIALRTAWGPLLQLLALAGLAGAFVRRRPADLLLSVLPVTNYLLMGSVRVNQPRYFLLGTPFLLVLAARLLESVWGWERPSTRLWRTGCLVVVALLVAWPAGFCAFQDYMLLQPDPRVVARTWIEENVPAGSRVVVDVQGPALVRSPESWLAVEGPPQGRFASLQREVAADYHPSYWVLPIRHFIARQDYLNSREATVQPLDWYRTNGYEYIVTSSMLYDSYNHWPGVAERYPKTMAFYEDVAREAELLAEFEPVLEDPRDFTSTDLNPIPTIRVYYLSPTD